MRNAEWSVKSGRVWTLRGADSRKSFSPSVVGRAAPTTKATTLKELSTTMYVAGVLVGSGTLSQQHERLAAGACDWWQSWGAGC